MNQNKFNSADLSLSAKLQILTLAYENKASHIGGALSIVDVLAVLYSSILNYNIVDSKDEKRDRLFYSKGHCCTALYAILAEVGFYEKSALGGFTKDGSYFTSHVNNKVPGIELSTGSLGHALSVACGVAIAGKRKSADWRTYCILSDGELNEGSNWEAVLFAAHHNINNLTVIIDFNKIQSFGRIEEVIKLEPLAAKFESFGFEVFEIDGHNHSEIFEVLSGEKYITQKPKVIIANTVKGKGVPFMENKLAWHYKSPSEAEYNEAINFIKSNN